MNKNRSNFIKFEKFEKEKVYYKTQSIIWIEK
jgi:hypothetical protein